MNYVRHCVLCARCTCNQRNQIVDETDKHREKGKLIKKQIIENANDRKINNDRKNTDRIVQGGGAERWRQ